MKEKRSRGALWKPNNEVPSSHGGSAPDAAAAEKSAGRLLFQIGTLALCVLITPGERTTAPPRQLGYMPSGERPLITSVGVLVWNWVRLHIKDSLRVKALTIDRSSCSRSTVQALLVCLEHSSCLLSLPVCCWTSSMVTPGSAPVRCC